MRKILLSCALLLALPLSASAEEICESVNDVSNAWNSLANLINEAKDDGFSDTEVDEIEGVVSELTSGSAELAGLLQGAGNDHQIALGNQLEAVLTEVENLDDEDEVNYIVGALDGVTATLDAATDDCDAAH